MARVAKEIKNYLVLILIFFSYTYTYSATSTVTKISDTKVNKAKRGMPVQTKANAKTEVATLAAGCFWGVEEILRDLKGVLETEVGYTGGDVDSPNYEIVKTGTTGHAEAVQIIFDPDKISFEEILGYFFRLHDPTQLNRQQNDIGTQYRSVIFYHNEEQKQISEKVKEKVDKSGKWKNKVVTQIVPFKKFYKAESYHQDYLQKNPNGYTCHFLRD